jgi:hypothetical protein
MSKLNDRFRPAPGPAKGVNRLGCRAKYGPFAALKGCRGIAGRAGKTCQDRALFNSLQKVYMTEIKATIDAELIYNCLMIYGKEWVVLVNMYNGKCKRFTYDDLLPFIPGKEREDSKA